MRHKLKGISTVFKIFFVITLSLLACSVFSETFRDYYEEPGTNPFKESINDSFNENINTFSGMVQLSFTDLLIPGNGGMDIRLTRTYNSLQTYQYPTYGSLGAGWTMHLGRVVIISGFAGQECAQSAAGDIEDNPAMELPDGSRHTFFYSNVNDGSLITQNNYRMVCDTNNAITVTAPNGTQYTMSIRDQTNGEVSWLPSRIEDVHGNALTLEYEQESLQSQTQLLQRIKRSEEGDIPVVSFMYKDLGGRQYLDKVISGSRTITYAYGTEDIGLLGTKTRQLTGVTLPEQKTWGYTYYPQTIETLPIEALPIETLPIEALPIETLPDDEEIDRFGSFSIKRVTYPDGATIDYTYQGVDFMGPVYLSTAIDTKTVNDGVNTYAYKYTFEPASTQLLNVSVPHDKTTVEGPSKIIEYFHMGKGTFEGSIFQLHEWGLQRQIDIYSKARVLLERRGFSWGYRVVSDEDVIARIRGSEVNRNSEVRLPVPLRTLVKRDARALAPEYPHWVDYGPSDRYGNISYEINEAGENLSESSQTSNDDTRSKAIRRTYINDTTRWVIGLEKDTAYFSVTGDTVPPLAASSGCGGEADTYSPPVGSIGLIQREYYSTGQLMCESRFGEITSYTYLPTGDLNTVTDPEGNVTTYSNYLRGIARKEDNPETHLLERTVNTTGTVASITTTHKKNVAANGAVVSRDKKTTSFTYDTLNRLQSITYPLGSVVSIIYNNASDIGLASRALTRGGYTETRAYDGFNRLLKIVRDGGGQQQITETEYDEIGRAIKEYMPRDTETQGASIMTEYDALDRVRKVIRPGGHTTLYNFPQTFEMDVIDSRGTTTTFQLLTYGIDLDNRNIFRIQTKIPNPNAENDPENPELALKSTTIRRNFFGQIESITQNGYGRRYEYNDQFRLQYETHPETGRTEYQYDAVGNVVFEQQDEQPAITYIYDDLYRLRTIDYADLNTLDTTYTYTEDGNLRTATKGASRWVYDYDKNQNLTLEELSISAPKQRTFVMNYSWNTLDNLASITFNNGMTAGFGLDLSPNPLGRPTQAGDYASQIQYHPNGQLKSYEAGNGVSVNIGLTARQFTDTLNATTTQNIPLVELDYDYDPNGNVNAIVDGLFPWRSVNVAPEGYDATNRLVTATGQWTSAQDSQPQAYVFAYHGNDDFAVQDWRFFLGGGDFFSNRVFYDYLNENPGVSRPSPILTAFDGQTIGYDGRGNVTQNTFRSGDQYVFDSADHLITYTPGSSNKRGKTFAYDANGYRYKSEKTGAGTEDLTFHFHSQSGLLGIETSFTSCERQTGFIRLGRHIIARRDTVIEGECE